MPASGRILQAFEANGHSSLSLMSTELAMFAIEIGCSEMNKGARNSSRETVLSNLVLAPRSRHQSICAGLRMLFCFYRTNSQRIGLHLVPLLDLETLRLEQRTYLGGA